METEREIRARSFGEWAEEYHESRPTYPAKAVEWMLADARRVTEAGAGTGKLTDRLVEQGLDELVVTEIDERMLRLVEDRHPRLAVHVASATSLPCDGGSLDAVVVADAWHWFPKEEMRAELGRVLRPGGWLSCIWNDNAASTPAWQWDAMQLRGDIAGHVRDLQPLERLDLPDGDAVQHVVPWTWRLSPLQWANYVATLSHVRTLPPEEYAEAITKAERLASEACEAASSTYVDVNFDSVCIRWSPA